MLRPALAYAARGLCIFPCVAGAKVPATPHGFKDATTDRAVIEQWWRTNPNYNIAVALGAPSNIIAIDIDGLDAEAALGALEQVHGSLPCSVEVITPRPGRHVYFRRPGRPVPCSKGKLAPGIEVKSDGSYTVLPPSLHPSGFRYVWSVDSAKTFAELPDWLLDRIAAPTNGHTATPPAEWRTLITDGVKEGQRNCSIARLAGLLLRRFVDPIVTHELLQAWNAARCSPPLPPEDVEQIVNSIAGRELRRRGCG